MTHHPVVEAVLYVAGRLDSLADEVVFVGGSAMPFLLPTDVAATVRVTNDVVCVVQANTTLDYYRIAERLRALGFIECQDEGAPICRWVVGDVRVDVMPTSESALGFHNRWYDHVTREANQVTLDAAHPLRIVSPACFLATKFEAFAGRGQGEHLMSADFEDIVLVLAHRDDIADQVQAASGPVRDYVSGCASELLTLRNVNDLVGSCLAPDPVSQGGVLRVLERLRAIASASRTLDR